MSKGVKIIFSSLFIFSLLLSACHKYEEDSRRTFLTPKDRFARIWIFDSYEKDGITTIPSADEQYTLQFKKNTNYIKSRIIGGQDSIIEYGFWDLNGSKTNLQMLIYDSTTTLESEIIKLSNKEFKIRDLEGTSKTTYRFIAQ